jgi:hypothetical protein
VRARVCVFAFPGLQPFLVYFFWNIQPIFGLHGNGVHFFDTIPGKDTDWGLFVSTIMWYGRHCLPSPCPVFLYGLFAGVAACATL